MENNITHLWPYSKSKFNLKSDRVKLVVPASPIEWLLYLANVRATQDKQGPERLTRLGNSNVLRLHVRITARTRKIWNRKTLWKQWLSAFDAVTFYVKSVCLHCTTWTSSYKDLRIRRWELAIWQSVFKYLYNSLSKPE